MRDFNDIEFAKGQVGTGWHGLVTVAYSIFAEVGSVEVDQVKEKFGALRIYYHYTTPIAPEKREAVSAAIAVLERESTKTCEVCGAPGEIEKRDNGNGYGWLKATCSPEHLERQR